MSYSDSYPKPRALTKEGIAHTLDAFQAAVV